MSKERRVSKLTKRAVDAAKAESNRFIVWDSELRGFGLRIEPTGHKSFIARYRAGGGRSGTLRQALLGRYGTITPEEARTAAKKLLGAAAGGADPVGEIRKARQTGLTVSEICDWYLEQAETGRILGRRGKPIKAATLRSDRGRIESHVRPLLGKRAVSALTTRDIEQMQADIAAHKTAREKRDRRSRGAIATGGSGAAGRTLGMLRAIIEHARRQGLVAENPARGARKYAGNKRKLRLSLEQVRSFGEAMRAAAADGEHPTGLAAIRLILLTGFRRSEALSIRREWLLPAGGVDFPDTKSGPQVRPIGRAATTTLSAQFRDATQRWAFPANRGEGSFVDLPRVLTRICRRAKTEGVTAHVLRHTFASIAAELDYSELTIAGLLGHIGGSVTSGYVHLDTALVSAADRVSTVIADALDGKPTAKVIPLREDAG